MDRVLVVYGRAVASTGLVGLAVGEQLSRAGLQVDVRPCSRAHEPDGYRAVILGSDVRAGCWEAAVVEYATRHAAALAERPIGLFQLSDAATSVNDGVVAGPVPSTLGLGEPATFNPRLLGPRGGEHASAPPPGRRRLLGLTEWSRVRLWALLLANELSVLTPA